ncbi:hypothetical protein CsSME_00050332 [Camellia sinensis var. sinensis]
MARLRPQVATTTTVLILFLVAKVISSGEATTIVLRPPHGGSNRHTIFLPLFLSPPPSSSSGNSSPSKCTKAEVKSLKDVANSSYAPKYDISGITDPFLHIRLLRFLRILGHRDADASDCMNDILAQRMYLVHRTKSDGTSDIVVFFFQDSNGSIRKRALELVYLFVNESNVKSLKKELIEYLEVSDQDFKGDLTAKICSIVEK